MFIWIFRFKLYVNVSRFWYNPFNSYTRIRIQSCSKMASQINLLGYFGKEKEIPLISVVLPLQIPQRSEADPSTKAA